jgi:hypothetical protein
MYAANSDRDLGYFYCRSGYILMNQGARKRLKRLHNGRSRSRVLGHRPVSEGIVEATLMDRAPRQPGDDRLTRLVAGVATTAPDRTLQQIATELEAMRERTPRGRTRWHPSFVKHLLARAQKLGLAGVPPAQVDPQVWR